MKRVAAARRAGAARRRVLLVGGPTAAGKSELALRLAESLDGTVINADATQVYAGLPILAGAPTPQDMARAPHRLYGVIPPTEAGSAGRWRDLALREIEEAWEAGRLPVIVGGSGLYLRALVHGVAPVPDVDPAARAAARDLLRRIGNAAFHARLAERDPETAARLHPGNSQRLVRAWEVLASTGRPLAQWQALPPEGGLEADVHAVLVMPPAAALREAIDRRFVAMVAAGALDEVRALLTQRLDPALPAMKALGVPELAAYLAGILTLDQAVVAAQAATRRYAKRQRTWFRHQFVADRRIDAQLSESILAEIFSDIRRFLLTS